MEQYAAKGGRLAKKKILKSVENNLDDYAWYYSNSEEKWHKKGQKKANLLGIYDMSGNLWEWCGDFYNPSYYKIRAKQNPKKAEKGDYRVIRGGSWTNKEEMMRISNRNGVIPAINKINIGFRIVYDIQP